LSPNCRVVELKQACYAGTAALHLAACYVQAGACPGAKVLVICSDTARAAARSTYYEPSQGTGSVAMLVSDTPHVMELDWGAFGYHSFEVMDTCRPTPEIEAGNSDLSLLSYLECLEKSFAVYQSKIEGVDFGDTFDFLAFHTPFAGMVKGAHRKMMRKLQRMDAGAIERDFEKRMMPSIQYCADIGNIYSATIYLALASLIDNATYEGSARVGFFSYGSGCSAEFYSGVVTDESKRRLASMRIAQRNGSRLKLPVDQYDRILDLNREWLFGVENREVSLNGIESIYESQFEGQGKLVLTRVKEYHREYIWS
jgi:polyketide biosynthesis 3-hydroxy-3-methylglutaryl-CoA synthase-like enzyme PksG